MTFEEFAHILLDHDEVPREQDGHTLTLDERVAAADGDLTVEHLRDFWEWSKAHGNVGKPKLKHLLCYVQPESLKPKDYELRYQDDHRSEA